MSKRQEIRVPDIGDFDKVPVIEILVAEGDRIEAEQSLLTLESDKATMEVPAPAAGTLVSLKVKEGDELSEGDVIGEMELDGEGEDSGTSSEASTEAAKDEPTSKEDEAASDAEAKDTPAPKHESAPSSSEAPSSSSDGEDLPPPPVPFGEMSEDPASLPHASPSVRRLARELGVDLSRVQGSGRKGRITEDDLKAHVKERMAAPASAGGSGLNVAEAPSVDFSKYGETEEEPLSRIKRISGPNLHRNWVSIPHVTQFDEADITEMEAFRKASQAQAEKAGTKMTPLVFLIKAVVAALAEFPQFNASLSADGQSLIRKKYFHVGVAVDTPNGLVVPVLRDCDRKGLIELAQELTDLSTRARDGKLKGDEMKGGCFSISSLGGIGGTAFTPIINAPELAILGVSRAQLKPVWDGEAFQPRLCLPLSLSYDHRVIDGADAARFTRFLASQLEDVRRMLL
ncbi:dihydrolipoyllysine-residue acetyltransferase [Wenzhouxiangella marina]|uniref:Acetyltransferase component of pyruvate dehydrogenase complex n=1 Tax=Wenzhouxiangella marina TaxID=1579979 RepID=A0A0K0XZ76_9GAMM|nr:dihydrolipoyllysine-residue acetyltransferase [Wenzhouxiangella marina]AKS42975.1 Acetyltransferase component of pyruvate dehydrogenase complex [Wenzhouxiangella marina]MBB6087341.1 pyruvate dehydrogenase E2 component (dihydrolipoamide acetyltransferase) [Wenzhouxiangella marina]